MTTIECPFCDQPVELDLATASTLPATRATSASSLRPIHCRSWSPPRRNQRPAAAPGSARRLRCGRWIDRPPPMPSFARVPGSDGAA